MLGSLPGNPQIGPLPLAPQSRRRPRSPPRGEPASQAAQTTGHAVGGRPAEFLRIVTAERADHFKPSDMPLLVQYAEAAALAERAVRELQRDDAKASWLTRWEKACRTLTALSARLRICPQSRQPNNPKRPEPTSYYEQMALEDGYDAQD